MILATQGVVESDWILKNATDLFEYIQSMTLLSLKHLLCLVDMFSPDSCNSYGYQLCSSSRRFVPLLVGDLQFTLYRGFSKKRKEACPIF